MANSKRQRDILPLPPVPVHVFDRKGVSRSIARRLNRKNKCIEWINDGIPVLNRLGGDGRTPDPTARRGKGSTMAMQHICSAYNDLNSVCDPDPTPDADPVHPTRPDSQPLTPAATPASSPIWPGGCYLAADKPEPTDNVTIPLPRPHRSRCR